MPCGGCGQSDMAEVMMTRARCWKAGIFQLSAAALRRTSTYRGNSGRVTSDTTPPWAFYPHSVSCHPGLEACLHRLVDPIRVLLMGGAAVSTPLYLRLPPSATGFEWFEGSLSPRPLFFAYYSFQLTAGYTANSTRGDENDPSNHSNPVCPLGLRTSTHSSPQPNGQRPSGLRLGGV
jgi:hypothetical protein